MSRPRILIVGAGFAGYQTARTLARLTRQKADITLLNPTDHFLYLPLLPQVAAGVLEPRRVTVSLPQVRTFAQCSTLQGGGEGHPVRSGPGEHRSQARIALSDNRVVGPTAGRAGSQACGGHVRPTLTGRQRPVKQEPKVVPRSGADRNPLPSGRRGRQTGTEVAAHGQLFTGVLVGKQPLRAGIRPRWMLLDTAPRVLPQLDEKLSRTADVVLRRRGIDVRTGTSVKEATAGGVLLSDGEFVESRTLVWCVGVRPDPLVESIGSPLERGRLIVDPFLQVPGHPEVFACGDAAAVPDLNKPGEFTGMTAQHAWRQGKVAARNVAASLGVGSRQAYRHRDLGFVVDLGGVKAAANPLGVSLSGPLAGAVTRGYHLAAMPGNRVRVAADWLLDAVLPRQGVQLGLVRSWSVPLDTASPELARMPGAPRSPGHDGPPAPRRTSQQSAASEGES
ncbi:FAD-dependent oxidoreductase [Streptomyces sp. NPDC047042]|uniref:NAD(P)/FAD-dependent oxidoreductase n=1 Tax=Streptomyces sp. NPDC047042 TaxID=3154807 RepID=UPI0034106547